MPLAYPPLPHQKQCLRRLNRARRAGKRRALIVMASRLGKTVTAAHFARRMIGRSRKKVLFLVHRKDILEQAKATFEAVIGGPKDRFDFFHGKRKRRDGVQFLFASFDAIRNVRKLFDKKEFALVVVDESHHGPAATYKPTIDYFEPEFCLAMTATPDRMDLQSIREIFGEEVFSLPIEEAIPQGLLCDAEYIVLTDEIVEQQLSGSRELTSEDGSKLKLLDLNRLFGIAKRDRKVVALIEAEIAKHRVKNPRLIVFCPSVAYANWLASFMPNSAPIHSKLPSKVRDDRMAAFRSGTLRAALVVDQFNEGVDIPDANVAVFLRSTVSRPMFLQQLARVLTKLSGKAKALVLDLVGNCERLEMVDALRQAVGGKRRKKGPQDLEAVKVHFKVNFTRGTRRVLDLVHRIRNRCSPAQMIEDLRALAEAIGRTPGQVDIKMASCEGKCASASTYDRVFGSIPKAQAAAGLSRRCSREQLIADLKTLAVALGRTPSSTDIGAASRKGQCASTGTFRSVFGSLPAAQKAAGFAPTAQRYSRQRLIADLKALATALGRTPSNADIERACRDGKCVGNKSYRRIFGSIPKAQKAAGLAPSAGRSTKKQLIDDLKALATSLGRTPSQSDINDASRKRLCSCSGLYSKVFGSLPKAQKAAGLSPRTRRPTRQKLVADLKVLATAIGHTPSFADLEAASRKKEVASAKTYIRVFGSLRGAQAASGLKPNKGGKQKS